MKNPAQQGAFAFVSYEGPKLPGDPNIRNLIRHRASSHTAAARKRNGGYVKHNTRQFPIWLPKPESRDEEEQDSPPRRETPGSTPKGNQHRDTYADGCIEGFTTCDDEVTSPYQLESIVRLASFLSHPSDCSGAAVRQNYPLLNLIAPLTVLHLGVTTLWHFRPDLWCISQTLAKMPRRPEFRPLLYYIPSRYGKVASITHATDSLLARLEQIVRTRGRWSPEWDALSLKSYTKALRSLQEAIDDESQRLMPETLCAVELLALFELLNGISPSDTGTWMRHAQGASRLIEFRGPDRFQTDFELSLFMTHAGPIVTEAFTNARPCFLEAERWQLVIQAAVRNDVLVPPEQALLVIEVWAGLGKGPNLFRAVEDLVRSPLASPPGREGLIRDLIKEQEHLKEWLVLAEIYQYGSARNIPQGLADGATALLRGYKSGRVPPEQQVTWRVLQGTWLLCLLVKSRLLYALSPGSFPELEANCQQLAREVQSSVADFVKSADERLTGGLFTSEIVWVADSVIETSEAWRPAPVDASDERAREDNGMIERWKLDAWCTAMGRKIR